ncbi:MAG: metal-dependent hydrolase [Parcubacteria group bacterium]|nr:MAG: metal-dependent hydrolase [Parcubacteria group bacterium]
MGPEIKEISLGGQNIHYRIKRVRRLRYIRLAVRADASVQITVPKLYPLFLIQRYLQQKWQWILENVTRQKQHAGLMSLHHSPEQIIIYKKRTTELVEQRLALFNRTYNFTFRRVSVRNQSTRWGSCSTRKNLNFNYRLCLLPADLADYIIVHELCHLGEMNHSQRFWKLVARTVPDYKNKVKILKNIG